MFNDNRQRLKIRCSRYPSSIFLLHLRQEVCQFRYMFLRHVGKGTLNGLCGQVHNGSFKVNGILPSHRKHLASGKIDFLLVEAGDFVRRHDKGAVDAHEAFCGEHVYERLEGHAGLGDEVAGAEDATIVVHCLDIYDFRNRDRHIEVFFLDCDDLSVPFRAHIFHDKRRLVKCFLKTGI